MISPDFSNTFIASTLIASLVGFGVQMAWVRWFKGIKKHSILSLLLRWVALAVWSFSIALNIDIGSQSYLLYAQNALWVYLLLVGPCLTLYTLDNRRSFNHWLAHMLYYSLQFALLCVCIVGVVRLIGD